LLLEEGLITPEQLDTALGIQKTEGGFLGRILVKQGFVSQEAVASALVKQCKIPHLSLLDYQIGPEVANILPEETCRRYHLLPIDKLGRILTVAMVDPLDLEALQAIREVCPELRIKPILCNWEHYALVADKMFATPMGKDGKAGQHSLTAESLGLRAQAPVPKQESKQEPPAPSQPTGAETLASAQAHSVTAHADAGAITDALNSTNATLLAAVRDGFEGLSRSLATASTPAGGAPSPEVYANALKEALKDALPQVLPIAPTAGLAPAMDAAALSRVLQDSVGGAMQEALATVMVRLRAESAHQPTLEQLAQLISTSQADLADSLSSTLRAVASANAGAAAPPGAPPMAQPEVLAAVIRDSVGGAMQEAMATLLVQMRALSGGRAAGDADATHELINALRESQSSIAHTIEHALESGRTAQEQTTQRLEQIAESALQSVQQAALLVENVNTHENQDGSRQLKRGTLTSVMPFKGRIPTEAEQNAHQHEADQQVYDTLESDQPQEAFTFSNFVCGKANAFTFKVGQAVAAKPGGDYNPFFLFGSVGLGKTHLISAIGNAINEKNPAHRVGYVSASHFSRRLSDAARANALDAFRENYCCWDVLILDDIQFLGGRVEAQEEFFHIFNTLHRAGRQIIIASDKAPDRLGLLEKRLVSRFASGIVAELKAPEWEARVEILRQYAQRQRAQLPDEILNLVAMRVPKDIRKMTGSLRKIIAYSELVGQEISCESANEILSHLAEEQAA
jgi:chromosomal replication initiator protein DnaA